MTPLITNAQMLDRFDGRWVGKNILDTGVQASIADLLDTNTTAGARLQTLITDASDEFMSGARIGARYTEDEVRTYGGNLVINIVAGLTLGPILRRRVRAVSDDAAFSTAYADASAKLEALRRGERILWAVPDVPEAGLPKAATSNPALDANPNLWSRTASRLFGDTGPQC